MLKELTTPKTEPRSAMNTRVPSVVRVIGGALYDDEESPSGIVLTGMIDRETLRFLRVDSNYQRPLGDREDIFSAIKDGTMLPPIEVGVRGQDYEMDGDDFVIRSPAYVIDGWQRVGTALKILEMIPGHPIRFLGTFHFDTNDVWERHRFTDLNRNVRRVSSNLHLRNTRDGNEAILCLYKLSNNAADFALYKKIGWSQNMHRGELMPAMMMCRIARRLHGHLAALQGANLGKITDAMLVVTKTVGVDQFRKNVVVFFDVVDECWGLRDIEFRKSATQLKQAFLAVLARLFSSHLDFWDKSDKVFFVSTDARRKLAKFPLNDPHVKNLAGAGGPAMNILYEMLLKHMDSGKRIGHLRPRTSRFGKGNSI